MLRDRIQLSAALGLTAFILILSATPGRSDPIPYRVQPVARADIFFPSDGNQRPPLQRPGDYLVIDGLNDQGQLLFTVHDSEYAALAEYSNGHFTPIALPLGEGAGGLWPRYLWLSDGSIDQQGNVAFAALNNGSAQWLGVFIRDRKTQQSTPVALPGQRPAAMRNVTFGGLELDTPLLNNQGEVALVAPLTNLAGNPVPGGLFFRDRTGQLMPVAIPGTSLPGMGLVNWVMAGSLNDAGVVAFLASFNGVAWSAFTWDKDKITPIALVGQGLPGGKTVGSVNGVWVNNVNRNVLLEMSGSDLYLLEDGQMTPVAVEGQAMPGGGVYRGALSPGYNLTVSPPNAAGQSVFVGQIKQGNQYLAAAYRIDADGQLSRVAQDGDTTTGGDTIAMLNSHLFGVYGAALNGNGQLALPVVINPISAMPGAVPAAIALFTPSGP